MLEQNRFSNVTIASVRALYDAALFRAALQAAPKERQQKALRFVRREDQALSLGAALLLKAALRSRGIAPDAVQIKFGSHGKPYLADRNDFFFNISHAGEFVMLTTASRENGCDIEKIADVDPAVARRVMTESEYRQFSVLESEETKKAYFFRCWTLKESYMKAVGLGFAIEPNSFGFTQTTSGETVLLNEAKASDAARFSFYESSLEAGYRCAVCQSSLLPAPQWTFADETVLLTEIAPEHFSE